MINSFLFVVLVHLARCVLGLQILGPVVSVVFLRLGLVLGLLLASLLVIFGLLCHLVQQSFVWGQGAQEAGDVVLHVLKARSLGDVVNHDAAVCISQVRVRD